MRRRALVGNHSFKDYVEDGFYKLSTAIQKYSSDNHDDLDLRLIY